MYISGDPEGINKLLLTDQIDRSPPQHKLILIRRVMDDGWHTLMMELPINIVKEKP
jgi:hypothetical protein